MTPQWMTAERLAKLAELCERDDHKCLKGHVLCPDREHYKRAFSKTEISSHPITAADVRAGRAIAPYCHGMGIVDLALTASRGPVVGPMRVTVWEWETAYLHEATAEETIASWQADDREQRSLDWKREQQAIIDGTYGEFGGRFDPVARDQFMAQRPEFYLTATGVDGVHFTPVAVVRVPSTGIYLYINVSAAFVKTTKSQRRHARRHGKPVQQEVTVEELCKEATRLWWHKRS